MNGIEHDKFPERPLGRLLKRDEVSLDKLRIEDVSIKMSENRLSPGKVFIEIRNTRLTIFTALLMNGKNASEVETELTETLTNFGIAVKNIEIIDES